MLITDYKQLLYCGIIYFSVASCT